jgi:DNA-binding MarR family transcriptional regulator
VPRPFFLQAGGLAPLAPRAPTSCLVVLRGGLAHFLINEPELLQPVTERKNVTDQLELPYGGDSHPNSGHSGSDTSRERAEVEDASGVTGRRQQAVLLLLESHAEQGATWFEVADALGIHHGAASAALSNLHKVGRIARLTERRDRSKVYVTLGHVNERAVEEHGRTATSSLVAEFAELVKSQVPLGCRVHRAADPHPDCWSCRASNLLAIYERRR